MESTQGAPNIKPDPVSTEQGASTPEDRQPKSDGDQLDLVIKSQDGSEVKFRVKGHTPFQKVFHAWAKKKGVDEKLYRFVADGHRIHPHETPDAKGVQSGDVIDAFIMQQGGLQL